MRRTERGPYGLAPACVHPRRMMVLSQGQQQEGSGRHRWRRAFLLQGLWRFRWYHAVAIWALLAVQAWRAWPYLLVPGFMPTPGTFPRYVGTIRVEGELRRGSGRNIPPKYFIRTAQGEVEFHCGYRPSPSECLLSTSAGVRPDPAEIYEIGYDPWWGIDYIRHPPRLSGLDERGTPQQVASWRIHYLRYHRTDAFLFVGGLLLYAGLVHAAAQRSRTPEPTP